MEQLAKNDTYHEAQTAMETLEAQMRAAINAYEQQIADLRSGFDQARQLIETLAARSWIRG